jgi:hypothetical protein
MSDREAMEYEVLKLIQEFLEQVLDGRDDA